MVYLHPEYFLLCFLILEPILYNHSIIKEFEAHLICLLLLFKFILSAAVPVCW